MNKSELFEASIISIIDSIIDILSNQIIAISNIDENEYKQFY